MVRTSETDGPSGLWAGIVLNVAIALLLLGVIVAAAWRENAAASERARERVEVALVDVQAQAARLAKDYGWWDEAYRRLLRDRDTAWAAEYVGDWLGDTAGLGLAVGLSERGEVLFTWPEDGLDQGKLAPLLADVRQSGLDVAGVTAGFVAIDGRPTLIAISALRPRESAKAPVRTGMLVFGWDMQDNVLPRLRTITRMPSLREVDSRGPAIPLWGLDGNLLTRVGWVPEQPGGEFLAWVLPATGASLAILSAIAWRLWRKGWRHSRALAAANASRIRLLAAISHDLRQPLQSLALFTGVLETEAGTERARKAAANLRVSIDRMGELLEAILDLARLDMGMRSGSLRAVALNDVLAPLVREMQPQAEAKGLALRYVPTTGVADSEPVLLGTLVRNLISNALRYTQAGKVLVGCRRRPGVIEIWICDTGIGISADKQALIFEEFYQVSNPARDYRQGVGLGLAIVERVARLLGHRVRLSSQPGRGSRFMVELSAPPGSCR